MALIGEGQSVLDVGCGTGVLALTAAARVGRSGRVTGLDANDGMLDVARQRGPSVTWQHGTAEDLPFADDTFDATLSQFALMFFIDPDTALAEMRRVTRPGGQVTVAVWGSLANTPGYQAMAGLLRDLFGENAAEALRVPYAMGARDQLEERFRRVGLAPTATTLTGAARFPSIEAWVHTDIRGWTLADAIDDEQYERCARSRLSNSSRSPDPMARCRSTIPLTSSRRRRIDVFELTRRQPDLGGRAWAVLRFEGVFLGGDVADRREVDTLLAVHELMRRDAGRLVARIDACTADPSALAGVARWFDAYRSALIQHHEVEDHLLFPAAERKDRTFASARAVLEPQHEDMEHTLTRLGAALGNSEPADAGAAARELEEILNRHLDLEEAAMVAIVNGFSDEEFKAVDRAAARMHPVGESLMYLGWMIDGFDKPQRANFFAWQPRSVRVASALAAPFYRRRARLAGMRDSKGSDMDGPLYDRPVYANALGLPADLVRLIERTFVCEYASNKADGTPITTALSPTPGVDGRTIDVDTGLAYPLKAERARRDPRVCLLFSDPAALPGDRPPVALLYGRATVRDADLQRNADRAVANYLAVSPSFQQIPGFLLRRMAGYLARIRLEITPERILWWPEGDLDRPPQQWHAAAGTNAPPSDPPPIGPCPPAAPVGSRDADPVASVAHALANLGSPILTARDEDGYPVPFRAVSGSLKGTVVQLDLHPHGPAQLDGRACLTFHTVKINRGDIVANENRTYVGSVAFDNDSAEFTVERQLPTISRRQGLRGNLDLVKLNRRLKARLEPEATRRGQPVPTIRLPTNQVGSR